MWVGIIYIHITYVFYFSNPEHTGTYKNNRRTLRQTGARELEVVADVAQLFLVLVQLERRARHVVVLLDLVVERRVRVVGVGRVQ